MNNQKKLKRYAIKVRYPEGRDTTDHILEVLMSRRPWYKRVKEVNQLYKDYTHATVSKYVRMMSKAADTQFLEGLRRANEKAI